MEKSALQSIVMRSYCTCIGTDPRTWRKSVMNYLDRLKSLGTSRNSKFWSWRSTAQIIRRRAGWTYWEGNGDWSEDQGIGEYDGGGDKLSKVTQKEVRQVALEILRQKWETIPYGELKKAICEKVKVEPAFADNATWNLDKLFPKEVIKPERGLIKYIRNARRK